MMPFRSFFSLSVLLLVVLGFSLEQTAQAFQASGAIRAKAEGLKQATGQPAPEQPPTSEQPATTEPGSVLMENQPIVLKQSDGPAPGDMMRAPITTMLRQLLRPAPARRDLTGLDSPASPGSDGPGIPKSSEPLTPGTIPATPETSTTPANPGEPATTTPETKPVVPGEPVAGTTPENKPAGEGAEPAAGAGENENAGNQTQTPTKTFEEGTSASAVQTVVLKILKGDTDGYEDVIEADAKGTMGRLVKGELPADELAELQTELKAVQLLSVKEVGSNHSISLANDNRKAFRFDCWKTGDTFKIRNMTISKLNRPVNSRNRNGN